MRHDITILKAQENHWATQPKESQVTSTSQEYDLNFVFFHEGSPASGIQTTIMTKSMQT
jgi:hypothetical protein